MSGSIAGQSNIARSLVPPGAVAPIGAADVGTPCVCDCTGTPVGGVAHGSSFTGVGGVGFDDHTDSNPCMAYSDTRGIMCSSDMDVTLTIASLTPHGGSGYAASNIFVAARIAGLASMYSWGTYVFGVVVTGGGAGTAQWQLYTDFAGGVPSNTAPGTVPAPGDVLDLSVIGSAIVAKRNGSTIFSITDSSVGDEVAGRPTSYAGWAFAAAATSDVSVSGLAATPTCP